MLYNRGMSRTILMLLLLLVLIVIIGYLGYKISEGFVSLVPDATPNCIDGCKQYYKCYASTDSTGKKLIDRCSFNENGVSNESGCNKCKYCQWCVTKDKVTGEPFGSCISIYEKCTGTVDAPKKDWTGGAIATVTEFVQYFLGYNQPATDACGANVPIWSNLDDGLANLKKLRGADASGNVVADASADADEAADAAAASDIATIASDAAARAALIRDIEAALKQDLLANKGMTTANSQDVLCEGDEEDDDVDSAALMQGQEYSANCPNRPDANCPKDMSQYIRKDSIPCWNCSLD
jgi:hypothetical protein